MDKIESNTGICYRMRNEKVRGRAIVFVHGAGGNKLVWLSMTRRLAELLPLRPMVLIDLPGHGGSKMPGCDTIGEYAAALEGFIKKLGLAPIDLVGHSLGGAVSLTLSLDQPILVRRLAVIASGYSLPTAPSIIQAIKADFEGAMRMIKDVGFGPDADPVEVNTVLEGLLACNPDTVLKDFTAGAVYDVKDRVPSLLPSLAVYCGTNDMLTSEPRNKALALSVPGAEYHVFENAGHMLQVERPIMLAEKLAEYFGNVGEEIS